MAIASMVLGILGLVALFLALAANLALFPGILSILALIFGFVGKHQARRRGDAGRGMAIAGIVLGVVGLASLILLVVLAALAASRFDSVGAQLGS